MPRDPVFRYAITVPPEAFPFAALRARCTVDGNGHANHVPYVQWMQDGTVRSHRIEYLRPAFAGPGCDS